VFVCVDPLHDCATHVVPDAYFWHAPAPLHVPLVPHDAAPWSEHSLSGSALTAMFVQVPSEPASLHDWHDPPHDELQQYPSMQFPVEHWFVAVHAVPFAFFAVQTPLAQ
jgi:hypothetical protein